MSQGVLLCGGAAIAMVERWWGRRGVFAETFAHLVRPDEGGIRTTDVAETMASRGWNARAVTGTASLVQQSLADSAPVIALIRVADRRYHYVVILGWRDDRVTYHDPAGVPFTTLDTTAFMSRWRGAKQWALLVSPAAVREPAVTSAPASQGQAPVVDSLPCRPFLDRAADAASAGDLDAADRQLGAAAARCPAEPLIDRELAGVRFRQQRHADAVRHADLYTSRVPGDSLGWQLLASSRYLIGDLIGALRAWHRVGKPRVDLVQIDGTRRTPFRSIMAVTGIAPASVLTAPALATARRRLADLPTLGMTSVTYAAVPGGVVELRAVANERRVFDPVPGLLLNTSIDAIFRRDVHLSLASPLRLGELWTMQWRWQPADPRVAVRVAIPVRLGIPVVAQVEQSWERYRFTGPVPRERRNAASFALAGWARPSIEAMAGLRLERWGDRDDFVALRAGTGYHSASDRVGVLLEGDRAIPRNGGRAYQRLHARVAAAPPADRWGTQWTARLGLEVASAATPSALQPLAGGDLARTIPLRAHPFILDGALPSARIARTITHGGVAGDRAILARGPIRLGAGVFLDGANIGPAADGTQPSRFYLDAGAGLRLALAGTQWAALRVDVARGLTFDRRWGLTAGLAPAWPIRLGRHR